MGKYKNALKILEANKAITDPQSEWQCGGLDISCIHCYFNMPKMICKATASWGKDKAFFESCIAAHDKRKAEKRAAVGTPGCGDGQGVRGPVMGGPRTPPQEPPPAPLIPEPPDTPDRFPILRKRAEAVIKHYPIPADDDTTTTWACGVMDSRLLADEVIAFLDEETRRRG